MNVIKAKLFQKIFYKFNKFAAAINLKPTELDLKGKKCLCLVPHPDDETIGMGGLLTLFPCSFEVVLLTDGRKGVKDKTPEEVIQLRQEEFALIMALAKIEKYSFLNVEDKKLLSSFNFFKNIDISEFDYIFVPNIIDQHPDHKAVSFLLRDLINSVSQANQPSRHCETLDAGSDQELSTKQSCSLMKKNELCSGSNSKVKPDLKIVMYEVWSTLGLTNAFVDITEVVDTKRTMINAYESQTAQKDYEYHALGLNQYRGMLKDKKYVEAFFVLNLEDFKNLCELY